MSRTQARIKDSVGVMLCTVRDILARMGNGLVSGCVCGCVGGCVGVWVSVCVC